MTMTTDDGIEMRIRHWADFWQPPTHWRVFCGGFEWILMSDSTVARVDGGDPGDENDGE